LPIGTVTLAGVAGGAWWGWIFVTEQLAPLIEKNLSQTLNRPVKLGQVERFTLTSIRFAPSEVPATATDPDRLAIEQIDVTFNPLQVLLTRTLRLDITVDRLTLYIEQTKDGTWISTQIQPQEAEGPITTEIDAIRFRDAEIVLVPWAKYGDKLGKPIVLEQTEGNARFLDQNQRVSYELNGRSTTDGELRLQGESLLQAPFPSKIQLRAQNFLLSEVDRLVKFPFDLQAGRVNSSLKLEVAAAGDPRIDGTAQFTNAALKIPNTPAPFRQANGTLQLRGTEIRLDDIRARFGAVPLLANGKIDLDRGYNLKAQVKPVSLPEVIETLQFSTPVPITGEIVADLNVTGGIETPIISGTARNTKPVRVDRVDFSRLSSSFRLDAVGEKLTVSNLRATPAVGGLVTGSGLVNITERPTVAFTVQITDVPATSIARTYAGPETVPFEIGQVDATLRMTGPADAAVVGLSNATATLPAGGTVAANGQIRLGDRPTVDLTAQAINVNADPIARSFVGPDALPFPIGQVNGTAAISGPTDALAVNLADVRLAPPQGGSVTAAGRVNLGGEQPIALNFRADNLAGDAIARAYNQGNPPPITIGRIDAQGQIQGTINNPQAVVNWQAPAATYAASGQIIASSTTIDLRNTVLNVGGGTVWAEGQLAGERWQAIVSAANVPLRQFSPDLRGQLDGNLTLAGTTSFRPSDIRAQGQVNLSEGIAVIDRPLTAQARWDGQKVVLQRATAPGFSANGFLFAQLEGPTPGLTGFDLNVRLDDFDLQAFAVPVPVQYSGRADFNGRIAGSPTAPTVTGNLALRQFVLNGVAFEPVLRGTVQVDRGVNVNLTGPQDRIIVALDPTFQPIKLDIRQGNAIATGQRQGDQFLVEAQNFPAALLGPLGQTPIGTVGGEFSGNLAVNLRTYDISGDVAIANLSVGGYRADRFGGRISFANGIATLTGAELRRGESVFQIGGTATLRGADPQINADIRVERGNVQDVLELAQIFELEDLQRGLEPPTYGNASVLQTVPIDLTNAPILEQLKRLAQVEAFLQQINAQRDEAPLPELRELQGLFSGEIKLTGSPQQGFNTSFDIRGENWVWGPYRAAQVTAIGSVENGTLTLLPVRLQTDQSFIAFSGQVGAEQLSGQFRMEQVPVATVKELLDAYLTDEGLPLNIDGQLNATATLSGSLQNPQVIGDLSLINGVLNGTDVQSAQGNFRYINARLDFDNRILVTGTEPLNITGSIPYRLPFATVGPESDRIALDINVRDEGLALLNVLNNQIAWVGGKGEVRLTASGTVTQPIATGIIRINNGTLQSLALPDDPITDVNALITLAGNSIKVEQLSGNYSRGKITASGALPIFGNLNDLDFDTSPAITVALEQIQLNLKGLYRGGVNGTVRVGGTALTPILGGDITLSNGEVQLAQAATPTASAGTGEPQADAFTVGFANLNLQLGNNLRVTQAPLINFVATGGLRINGSLDDIRPAGTIRLTAGQVNLFTTQFTLARGYEHTATFDPDQGLDPNLNIRLIAVVPEVTGYRQPTNLLPSEILDTPNPANRIGGVQTVRVQAEVQGPASQIFENLELTSRPARSESEIVALIGGGFVQTLGRGDSALGIANLAGSALLTNVQTVIGNALGLSEFRIFPTVSREEESSDGTVLGLAAEAAIDITPSLSFSTVVFLNSNQSALFGLRYRINDNLLVRTSTSLTGEFQAIVEYESRF
jgi:translocation and assembly module TamB